MSSVAIRNEIKACNYFRRLQRVKTLAAAATIERATQFPGSMLTGDVIPVRTDRLVTVIFAAAHGLVPGNKIGFEGCDVALYNRVFVVETVPSDTSITFTLSESLVATAALPADPTTGTAYQKEVLFRRATMLAKKDATTANTGDARVGWSATLLPYDVPTGAIPDDIEAPLGSVYDLADLYIKVGADGDGLIFIYA